MSWIQKLYETYEACKGHEPDGAERLLPISHAYQQAHVEITLDGQGNFESARGIGKVETAIPATEKSAGRTNTSAPHPLCDKIQYCASDYMARGGGKPSFFQDYEEQLSAWCASKHCHPKAEAVLAYVRKGSLITNLVSENILHVDADGKLMGRWNGETPTPAIFKVLSPDQKTKLRDQGNVFIRWHVREAGNPCTAVWDDPSLQDAWIAFDASTESAVGTCMVTGNPQANLATSHPRRIRHPGDGAKLISANDKTGYTFRGHLNDVTEKPKDPRTALRACSVSYEVSLKAHNALRWLIQRQGYRNGEQVIVSWAVGGAPIPDPFGSSLTLMSAGAEDVESTATIIDGDAGLTFAQRLNLLMRGYRAKLGERNDIVVMGLDSATPGRMAVTYYRELTSSEFLERIESWHANHAWHQNFGKDKKFVGAPAPHDIAVAAFATRLGESGELRVDEKLLKATVERLLPCIIDGRKLPRDLLISAVNRTCNRVSFKRDKKGHQWEWEKQLGITCALFKGFFKERGYEMALETDRTSRDYLYGRLLAIAEHIEGRALYVGGETRDTTAAKLMQRFADRPASAWRTIELALTPAKSRLRAKRGPFLREMEKLHDEVVASFVGDDFLDDSKLSGEFLLGYHCQRQILNPPKAETATSDASDDESFAE